LDDDEKQFIDNWISLNRRGGIKWNNLRQDLKNQFGFLRSVNMVKNYWYSKQRRQRSGTDFDSFEDDVAISSGNNKIGPSNIPTIAPSNIPTTTPPTTPTTIMPTITLTTIPTTAPPIPPITFILNNRLDPITLLAKPLCDDSIYQQQDRPILLALQSNFKPEERALPFRI
jgi:hypothetical protein